MIYNNSSKEVLQHLFYENNEDFWMKLRNSIPKLMNPCELEGILSHVMIKLTTQFNRTLKINNYLMKLKRLQMGLKRVIWSVWSNAESKSLPFFISTKIIKIKQKIYTTLLKIKRALSYTTFYFFKENTLKGSLTRFLAEYTNQLSTWYFSWKYKCSD